MHEMEVASVTVEPLGPGAGTIDHEVPFHERAMGDRLGLPASPEAVHEVALTQATPPRKLSTVVSDSGAVMFVQDVPFHVASWLCHTDPVNHSPTATQKLAPAHDTPSNCPLVPEPGLGVVTTVQPEPFQTWASETKSLLAFSQSPTAMQDDDVVQEMLFSSEETAPAGGVVGVTVQTDPFHVSARVRRSNDGVEL
jgi:hypothetical protein